MMKMPYFMTDTDWYTVEHDERGEEVYKLTYKAPEEAVKSYKQYVAFMKKKKAEEKRSGVVFDY